VNPAGRSALQQELTALARGERAAFDPLFRRLWPLLRGFARRFLSAEEADDVAQEALLRIFRRASEFDPGRDALAWVLGIVAWQVRTQRTKARRRREEPAEALPERETSSASPEEEAAAAELTAALDRALAEALGGRRRDSPRYARGERRTCPGPRFTNASSERSAGSERAGGFVMTLSGL
jgi:RNA polymerase sigma-70 factor (ECF subfamily)